MGWTAIYQLFWCELQGYQVLTHCHIFPRHSPLNIPILLFTNDVFWWFVFVQLVRFFFEWHFSIRMWDQLGQRNQQNHRFFPREEGYNTVKIPWQTPTHPRNWDSLNKNLNWNLFQIHVWKLGRRFKIFQVYTFWLFNISMDNCKCIDHLWWFTYQSSSNNWLFLKICDQRW